MFVTFQIYKYFFLKWNATDKLKGAVHKMKYKFWE